jgi:hypothetical protein
VTSQGSSTPASLRKEQSQPLVEVEIDYPEFSQTRRESHAHV